MFKRIFSLVICSIFLVDFTHGGDVKTEILNALRRGCYLQAWRKLNELDKEDLVVVALNSRLNNNLEKERNKAKSVRTVKAYLDGVDFLISGQSQEARNEFRKFLGYAKVGFERVDSCRVKEAEEYLAASRVSKPEMELSIIKEEPRKKEIEMRPGKKKERKKPPKQALIRSPEMEPKKELLSLAQAAARAKENGQLEYALRLYRMAEDVNPESLDYEVEINEITGLME